MITNKLTIEEFKELVFKRDTYSPSEILVINNKEIYIDDLNLNNIMFNQCDLTIKNCTFKNINFFACTLNQLIHSSAECIKFESCSISNLIHCDFKHISFVNCEISEKGTLCNCVLDDLTFKNSFTNVETLQNTTIKNTDFRGQEEIFINSPGLCDNKDDPAVRGDIISPVERAIRNIPPLDLSTYLPGDHYFRGMKPHDKITVDAIYEEFYHPVFPTIAWHNLNFINCKIDLKGIEKLSKYSQVIDCNFSAFNDFCTGRDELFGHIILCDSEQQVKNHLIASTFLYDSNISYEINGEIINPLYAYKLKTTKEEFPNKKLKTRVALSPKKHPMIILDNDGNVIDPKSIVLLDNPNFSDTLIPMCTNPVYMILKTYFEAKTLNNDMKFNKPFKLADNHLEK